MTLVSKQSTHRREAIFEQRVFVAGLIVGGDRTTELIVREAMSRFGFSRKTAFRRISEAKLLLAKGRGRISFATLSVTKGRP